LRLAAVLRRAGKPGEAVTHYEQILNAAPDNADARFGLAAALVDLRRYAAARDRLREAMTRYPDQQVYRHALARLLATVPDAAVRNGPEALALVQDVMRSQRTPDVGETLAMALAELGRYEEAAGIQRDLIAGGEKAGRRDIVRRLEANLRRYERGEPCRTPWADEELP
jgi:tetratricopeptide (TPR) repeat protein